MISARQKQPITITEYLSGELISPIKREFVDGAVYSMPESTVNHSRIATNATVAVGAQLRGKRCQVFNSDMKVRKDRMQLELGGCL